MIHQNYLNYRKKKLNKRPFKEKFSNNIKGRQIYKKQDKRYKDQKY